MLLNCINLQLARDMRIPFQKTNMGAQVPGDTAIELAGVTTSDLVLHSDFNGRPVPIHLGNAVVVDSLGSDVIIGEPAKQRNGLETHSGQRVITIRYENEILSRPYLNCIRGDYGVLRSLSSTTIYLAQNCSTRIPSAKESTQVVLLREVCGF